jgi:hypothetical protein
MLCSLFTTVQRSVFFVGFFLFFLSPSLKTRPLGDDDDDSTRPNEDKDDNENSIAGGKGDGDDDAGLPASLLGHLTPLIPTFNSFLSHARFC